MKETRENPKKKKTATETFEDLGVWDLEEDEERRREAFEKYCGLKEEELETEEERKRKKEKADKLEKMREKWQMEKVVLEEMGIKGDKRKPNNPREGRR